MSIKTLKIKKLDKTPAKEINPYFKDVKKNKINPIINKIIPINPEREFPKMVFFSFSLANLAKLRYYKKSNLKLQVQSL